MKKISVLAILISITIHSCKNDKFKPKSNTENPIQTTNIGCGNLTSVSFSTQVQPIINSKCTSCHDGSAGIKLDNYQNILLYANSGQLVGSLTGNQSYLQMPPTGPLDSCSIKTIVNWVQQGKLNN